MPRTTFAALLPLLAVPMMMAPLGRAVAGPPEGLSGAMELDKVADGLRQYQRAHRTSPSSSVGVAWPHRRPTGSGTSRGTLTDRSPNWLATRPAYSCFTSSQTASGGQGTPTWRRPEIGGRPTRPTSAAAPPGSCRVGPARGCRALDERRVPLLLTGSASTPLRGLVHLA